MPRFLVGDDAEKSCRQQGYFVRAWNSKLREGGGGTRKGRRGNVRV